MSLRTLVPATLLVVALCTSAYGRTVQSEDSVPEPTLIDVRDALAKRRALQIKRLRAYKEARLFPRNRVSDGVINVFRDEDGLLCAVANLIWLDGDLELVEETAKDSNTIKMGTLESGPLYDWILYSGFTRDEIAAIQLPDSPITTRHDWFARENTRIIAHLDTVEKLLTENQETALDTAAALLYASGSSYTELSKLRN